MRIFIAGATGAIGRRLVPKLTERGHDVAVLTRSARSKETAREKSAMGNAKIPGQIPTFFRVDSPWEAEADDARTKAARSVPRSMAGS
jgi:nucleoside-diphosphate-sugar epimerase